jgi:signal transduction histidine kinase
VTSRSRNGLLITGALLWVLLTVTLAGWWMFLGLAQARQIGALHAPEASRLERVQRMIVWEGVTFIGLLIAGGAVIVVSIRREHARQQAVEAFFMAFTHDLKTALASLQLQAESLSEDLPEAAANPNMGRLLKDTLRLGVQLENSLYFAQPEGHLLVEPVSIAAFIGRMAGDWPELRISVEGDQTVLADARALESVWRNLLQNAVIHGGARQVIIRVERQTGDRATITAIDDGRGAPPQVVRTLGVPFKRPVPTSGTGVGLFVSQQLARRMNGELKFRDTGGPGFTAVLELPLARSG